MPVTSRMTIHYCSLTWNPFYCFRIFPKDFWPLVSEFLSLFLLGVFFFFASLHIMKSRKRKKNNNIKNNNNLQTGQTNTLLCWIFFRLSHEKSVKSMCYLKIFIKVYLMHKTNHAYLVNRWRMDRNTIRSGDKIQNGRDRKFCRLTL